MTETALSPLERWLRDAVSEVTGSLAATRITNKALPPLGVLASRFKAVLRDEL
jgi:hypothetical protein